MIDMKTGDVHLDKGLVIKRQMQKKEFIEAFLDEFMEPYKGNSMAETTFCLTPRVVEGVSILVDVHYTDGDHRPSIVEIYHEDDLYRYEYDKRKLSYDAMCEMLETIVRRDFATSTRFHTWGSCGYSRDPREGTAYIVLSYY